MTDQLSFQESISSSLQLIEKIDKGSCSTAEATELLSGHLKTVESARGFFVSLLTEDWNFGDDIPVLIVDACRRSGDVAAGVLTKNLVMSTCMQVHHLKSNDKESAEGSKRVARRSIFLINKLGTDSLQSRLEKMKDALDQKLDGGDHNSENEYVSFLTKWKYDPEQMCTARSAVEEVLESVSKKSE